MKKTLLLLLVTALTVSCTHSTTKTKPQPKAKHVVFIGLDGWGSYSVEKAEMPNVKKLMSAGSFTLQKRAVLPSSSAVNWASMFMGACPELHGYTTWGSKTPEIPSRVINKHNIFPTMFQLLRDANPQSEIGCLYEWDGIKYLVDTLSLNYFALAPDYIKNPRALTEMSVKYIQDKKPDLVAIIYDNPDHAGHGDGHDTPGYYKKLIELDGYVGEILQAVSDAGMMEETIFIVTSDHGGIDKGHGGKTLQEVETPFIISGKNILQGGEFQESMMQFDVAPTVLEIFGIEQPQVWVGRSMSQVFK